MSLFNNTDRQWMIPCGEYARLRCGYLARPQLFPIIRRDRQAQAAFSFPVKDEVRS